jgi:hypothetical protein
MWSALIGCGDKYELQLLLDTGQGLCLCDDILTAHLKWMMCPEEV